MYGYWYFSPRIRKVKIIFKPSSNHFNFHEEKRITLTVTSQLNDLSELETKKLVYNLLSDF